MLRLTLDDLTLRSTRVVTSPLWECIASLTMLIRYRGEPPSPYATWARAVRHAMAPDELRRLRLGSRDLLTLPQSGSWIPVPDATRPDITSELHHLAMMHEDDGKTPRLLELLEQHWSKAVSPWWPAMRESLDQELTTRARALATGGPEAMMAELGGRLEWQRPQLIAPFQTDLQLDIEHSQFILVPMIFAGGLRILTTGPDDAVALCYQAQALGLTTTASFPPRAAANVDRLVLIVGRARAAVLRSLVVPTTTKALASSLGLAPSTVSQHLAQLAAAGVVRRRRVDGQVLYELDRSGFTLLRELGA